MNTTEKTVRDAAAAFFDLLTDARKAGLVVTWPGSPEGLKGLAISETAKAQVAPETKKPAEKADAKK